MAALSAMVSLEIPQINIMTKMDLLSPKAKKEIEKYVLKGVLILFLKISIVSSSFFTYSLFTQSHANKRLEMFEMDIL